MAQQRYADQLAVRMDARTDELIMRDHAPESLKTRELELDVQPRTVTPVPMPVLAWVHFGGIPLKVAAEALTWTPRAVGIRFVTPAGVEHKVWVWASAVEKREEQHG